MIGKLDLRPDGRKLRQFAVAWVVFFGLIWAPILLLRGHWPAAGVAGAVATLGGVAGAVRPAVLRPAFVALSLVTLPIGWIVSAVALAVMYYLVVVPIGLVLKLAGRDPLRRGLDPSAATYWREREQPSDADYFRQF